MRAYYVKHIVNTAARIANIEAFQQWLLAYNHKHNCIYVFYTAGCAALTEKEGISLLVRTRFQKQSTHLAVQRVRHARLL
jgi:hypothetical protein